MLEYVDATQQPAGFSDSSIATWRTESSVVESAQSYRIRDLSSSYLSSSARQTSYSSHSVTVWIGSKMTAVGQPTDVDVAFPLKAEPERDRRGLRQGLQEQVIRKRS